MINIKSLNKKISTLFFLPLISCVSPEMHASADEQFYGNVSDQDIVATAQIIGKIKEEYIEPVNDQQLGMACLDDIYPEHTSYNEFVSLSEKYEHPRIKPTEVEFKFPLALAFYINSKANTKIEANNLFISCYKSITKSLAPGSTFYTKSDQEELQKLPKDLGGIGVELISEDGPKKNTVVWAFKSGAAYAAGIRPGDIIVSVDGVNTKDLQAGQTISLLRGKLNSNVIIDIQRDSNEPLLKFNLQRKVVNIQIEESKLIAQDYGYIQISSLGGSTSKDFAEALLTLYSENKNNLKGLVLDLRFNQGGLLNQANGVVAPFLPKETLVTEIKGRNPMAKFKLTTHPDDHFKGKVDPNDYVKTYLSAYKKLPIVILINKESASGAEIIAAAMQEYRRATIIGQTSSGKNLLHTIFPMHSGEALKVATAVWLTPSGKSIKNVGIKPDITTEETKISEMGTNNDAALKNALNFLMQNGKI